MNYSGSLIEDLAWQVEAGADEAVGEVAGLIHWKAAPKAKLVDTPVRRSDVKASPLAAALGAYEEKHAVVTPLREASHKAQPVVAPSVSARSLAELKAELERYDGCDLKQTAINLVFADGNPDAEIMIIGDAPAEDEDRQGSPFAGLNGQLLDKMLAAIGLDRTSVYLTNLVFWRPPGNRTPTEVEIAACLPFTEQHIALKKPKFLMLFGATTAKSLLRRHETFSKLRGQWAVYTPHLGGQAQEPVRCLPLYHPSYLMRQPSAKRQAWADLLHFQKEVNDTILLKNKE